MAAEEKPFWKTKSLEQMTDSEWESRCTDYPGRTKQVPDVWLPPTCGYRLVADGGRHNCAARIAMQP